VPLRIAEARGQLALGNVALALESFRKAWREDPNSTDALLGMGTCYDRMGRFDLSRRNYESALALAPADIELLGAFAASLQLQGLGGEAAKVRQEITARATPAHVAPQANLVALAEAAPALPAPIASAPAAARAPAPVRAAAIGQVPNRIAAIPSPAIAPVVSIAPKPSPVPVAPVPKAAPTPAVVAVPAPVATAVAASSVTIKLPPPRSAWSNEPLAKVPEASQPSAPVQTIVAQAILPPATKAALAMHAKSSTGSGPRLERTSLGEVALVTTSMPLWRPTTIAHSARSTTVRFVPLRQASATPVQVRLLNAARVNRLAARTRTWLEARGWSTMSIGDAPATRARSVVLYPPSKRALAQRISAQFGFAMAERASGRQVTVLLGRDAAGLSALKPRGA